MYSAESRRQDFILPLVCLLWQCNLQKKSHWTHNSQSTAFKTECKICCRKHCVNAVILDTEKTLTNTGNYVQMQKCPLCQIYETYKCTILISALTFLKSCHDCNGFICMQMKKTPSSIWQHMHSILKKKQPCRMINDNQTQKVLQVRTTQLNSKMQIQKYNQI